MTHQQHLSLVRCHHAKAARFHDEMSEAHRRLGEEHEATSPRLAKLHHRLAGLHADHAAHHARLEKAYADAGVETHEFAGEELQRLAKLLSGE